MDCYEIYTLPDSDNPGLSTCRSFFFQKG